MNSKNKKIKLFSTCILVKGIKRSTICDLQRNSYTFIPNDLYEVIKNHDGKTIEEIKKNYDFKYDEILDDYFNFLLKKEFIFLTNYPELFPKMSLDWFEPFEINNAIVDVNSPEDFDYENILNQLASLKCKSLELRFFCEINLKLIIKILDYLNENNSILSCIGFVFSISSDITRDQLNILIANNPRISYLIITNSTFNRLISPIRNDMGYIIYSMDKVVDSTYCGLIKSKNFVVNNRLFTESQHHNTCLNKKISIDKNGNIKNCPSMTTSFGNIKDISLEEALNQKDFKKYWDITKDQIEVCKDCEFRHICTDCRAYIEDPDNMFSKPLKCGYSPYTNQWEEWSTNPLKQKAIDYYDMRNIIEK